MEIVFLIISLIITFLVIYCIGKMIYPNKNLLSVYKNDGFLILYNLYIGIILCGIIFATLCALNNTFWLLPYLTK